MAIRPRANLKVKMRRRPYICRFGHITTGESQFRYRAPRVIVCIICRRLAGKRILTKLPGKKKLSYDTVKSVEMATKLYNA